MLTRTESEVCLKPDAPKTTLLKGMSLQFAMRDGCATADEKKICVHLRVSVAIYGAANLSVISFGSVLF